MTSPSDLHPWQPEPASPPVRPHTWQLDEHGAIDDMVVDYDYHSGPRCVVCDWSFCVHCHPDEWNGECPGPEEESKA